MTTLFYCPIAHEIFIIEGEKETVWFETLSFETQVELLPQGSYALGIDTMYEFTSQKVGDVVHYFVDCEYSSSLNPSCINRWQMILACDGTIISKEIIQGTPGKMPKTD
jgi:hypothetical protein